MVSPKALRFQQDISSVAAMATKRKAENFPSGIKVEDGHAQIDEVISELPSQALTKCYALKEVSLPSSVRVIGASCFAQCSGLKIAKIPNSADRSESRLFLLHEFDRREHIPKPTWTSCDW